MPHFSHYSTLAAASEINDKFTEEFRNGSMAQARHALLDHLSVESVQSGLRLVEPQEVFQRYARLRRHTASIPFAERYSAKNSATALPNDSGWCSGTW